VDKGQDWYGWVASHLCNARRSAGLVKFAPSFCDCRKCSCCNLLARGVDAGEGAASWQGGAGELGLQDDEEEAVAEDLAFAVNQIGEQAMADRANWLSATVEKYSAACPQLAGRLTEAEFRLAISDDNTARVQSYA
jgi:hypothetical protein